MYNINVLEAIKKYCKEQEHGGCGECSFFDNNGKCNLSGFPSQWKLGPIISTDSIEGSILASLLKRYDNVSIKKENLCVIVKTPEGEIFFPITFFKPLKLGVTYSGKDLIKNDK